MFSQTLVAGASSLVMVNTLRAQALRAPDLAAGAGRLSHAGRLARGALAPPLHGQLDASGVSLFLMMLSAAIQCGFGAFRAVVARPKRAARLPGAVLRRSAGQLLARSGSCACRCSGASLGEPIQIGLDLVMLMPVAATASIWVRDTKGDIELLVSLVVITMSLGTLIAPTYLYFMGDLTANSIVIPRALILRQLAVGVLLPLVVGVTLNKRAAQAAAARAAVLRLRRQRRPVHGGVPQRRHRLAASAPSVARPDRLRDPHRARGQRHQLPPRLASSGGSRGCRATIR